MEQQNLVNIKIDRNKFIDFLNVKGLDEEHTIRYYMLYFDRLPYEELNQEHFILFLKKYKNNALARATIRNVLEYIKTSQEYAKEIKIKLLEIQIPKKTGAKKRKLPKVLTIEEVHGLARGMNNQRDMIMILLTFYGGLRRSELMNIKPWDFKWNNWFKEPDKNGILRVVGKRKKEREVFLIPEMMLRIQEFISNSCKTREEKIFKISWRRWNKLLEDKSKIILGRKVTPHLLRHSCGTYLYNHGLTLREVQEYLGHESIATTQLYTHIDNKQLSEKYGNAFD
jgi:integrase/recombinase XerD